MQGYLGGCGGFQPQPQGMAGFGGFAMQPGIHGMAAPDMSAGLPGAFMGYGLMNQPSAPGAFNPSQLHSMVVQCLSVVLPGQVRMGAQEALSEAVETINKELQQQMSEELGKQLDSLVASKVESAVGVHTAALERTLMERVATLEADARGAAEQVEKVRVEHARELTVLRAMHAADMQVAAGRLEALQAVFEELQQGLQDSSADDVLLQGLAGSLVQTKAEGCASMPASSSSSTAPVKLSHNTRGGGCAPDPPATPQRSTPAHAAAAAALERVRAATAPGPGVFGCPFACGEYFRDITDMQVHMLVAHDEEGLGSHEAGACPRPAVSSTTSTGAQATKSGVTLLIKNAKGGGGVPVTIQTDATLQHVRGLIQDSQSIPATRQMILVGGQQIKKGQDGSKPFLSLLPKHMQALPEISLTVTQSLTA